MEKKNKYSILKQQTNIEYIENNEKGKKKKVMN